MKELNSYKLFKKVVRKYYKRHDHRIVDVFNGKRFVSYWNLWKIWCYYLLREEDYNNPKIQNEFGYDMSLKEVPEYINKIKPLINKKVKAFNINNERIGNGIFKGIALVNFGIMLVIECDENQKFYFTNTKLEQYEE